MQTIALMQDVGAPILAPVEGQTLAFRFALTPTDVQTDTAYLDRPEEVHVNLALGRLCTIGCRECSATVLSRGRSGLLRGNLPPAAIRRKAYGIVAHLAPLLGGRRLVISTMNDGDPLTRSADELIAVVRSILAGCTDAGVALDRLNLSSSLVASKADTLIELADRYHDAFGTQVVQFQASLLATNVKRNIFTGDGRQLETIVEALGYYRERMRLATGRGETWINYVAVKRGDFGRSDSAEHLETIAKVADTLTNANPLVRLKITRGTVDELEGWEQLDDAEYDQFVEAVVRRWGGRLSLYCPDRANQTARAHRCGRIQTLSTL